MEKQIQFVTDFDNTPNVGAKMLFRINEDGSLSLATAYDVADYADKVAADAVRKREIDIGERIQLMCASSENGVPVDFEWYGKQLREGTAKG